MADSESTQVPNIRPGAVSGFHDEVLTPRPPSTLAGTRREAPAEAQTAESDPFDPSDHTVDEVTAYLDSADDAERDRVLAAERAGKSRKGITGDE